MEQVTINGQAYNVVNRRTPDDMEADGMRRLAEDMRDRGMIAHLHLQKPRGKKLYLAYQWQTRHGITTKLVLRKGF